MLENIETYGKISKVHRVSEIYLLPILLHVPDSPLVTKNLLFNVAIRDI